jgi:type IV secretion system protein VirB11
MTSPAAPLLEYLLRPLAPWLGDDATEDIAINQPGRAWVRHHGVWDAVDLPLSLADLEDIAVLAAALRCQDIGPEAPLCSTELPQGERLQICLPPIVPVGTVALTIRKHERTVVPLSRVHTRYHADDWNKTREDRLQRGMALMPLYDSGDLERFLVTAVREHLNILLVGVTGSGKTTLAKSLIGAISPAERIITIEDTLELAVDQPNTVRLLYSKDALSQAAVGPEALIETSLRMRPDRLIIGELREEQPAWVFLHQTTIDGTITTVHGHDAASGLQRFFTLCKGSAQGRGLDASTLMNLLSSAIDVILPLESRDGRFSIGATWFVADSARRGETAGDLLRAA